jgi:hypothetical protein
MKLSDLVFSYYILKGCRKMFAYNFRVPRAVCPKEHRHCEQQKKMWDSHNLGILFQKQHTSVVSEATKFFLESETSNSIFVVSETTQFLWYQKQHSYEVSERIQFLWYKNQHNFCGIRNNTVSVVSEATHFFWYKKQHSFCGIRSNTIFVVSETTQLCGIRSNKIFMVSETAQKL